MSAEASEIRKLFPVELGLAPMEGVTELATRLWFGLTSMPATATTPFLRVTKGFPFKRVADTFAPEMGRLRNAVSYRVIPQLMASEACEFIRLAEPFLNEAPFVELNCGCPAPVVVGHGAGSGLLEDVNGFRRFVKTISDALGDRFAVKLRTGFLSDSEFDAILSCLADLPLARLTVHGRTRAQRYLGKACWRAISKAAREMPFAVYGSGDVNCRADFDEARRLAPQISGVFLGRGALRNPWLFSELRSGKVVTLNWSTLSDAISVFAHLQELAFVSPLKLFELSERGHFREMCGADAASWSETRALTESALREVTGECTPSRGTVAKVKMLWNYLRSSLPEAYFDPSLLRSPDFESFSNNLERISRAHEDKFQSAVLTLQAQVEHDWIYSGSGKTKKEVAIGE